MEFQPKKRHSILKQAKPQQAFHKYTTIQKNNKHIKTYLIPLLNMETKCTVFQNVPTRIAKVKKKGAISSNRKNGSIVN